MSLESFGPSPLSFLHEVRCILTPDRDLEANGVQDTVCSHHIAEVVAFCESGKQGSLLENHYEANTSLTIFIGIMDADCLR